MHGHERLDVYAVALSVARWAARVAVPPARKHRREQLTRAADSVVLNIAEGAGCPPGDALRHHFRIAGASASEVAVVLDLLEPDGAAEHQAALRRIAAMCAALTRR